MIVYGDILFAENMIIGGVLLYITCEIHGLGISSRMQKLRLLAGSLLCGFFSLTVFLPVKTLLTLLMEAVFAVCVCCISFGREKLWQRALTFLLVTYFIGGMTMGLLLLTHHSGMYTAVGIYTGDMKASMLALFIGMALFTAKQVIKTIANKKFYRQHLYRVRLLSGENVIEAEGFLDTGNGLHDPVSGKPVAVAAESLWKRMDELGFLRQERYCAIPYEAVGGGGVLDGVRIDALYIEQRQIKGCIIAKGDGAADLGVKDAAGCEMLLCRDMMDRKF